MDQTTPAYRNDALPIEERVADLLARMTLEEKVGQLSSQLFFQPKHPDRRPEVGHVRNPAHFAHSKEKRSSPSECAQLINDDQRFAIENTRLGIPVLENGECLHGANWGDATCFPQAIALASTWDTAMMRDVATVIARELRAVGVRQVFAPVVNIARDSRWGRAQETYGEDPYLTARMGVEYVKALETANIIATPKHYAANCGDGGRDSNAIHFTERLLREIYLPAFKACFTEGGARGVMPAYNSIDGTPCSCNRWLLDDLLRKEWGFDGIVVSDYGGVWGIFAAHHMVADHPEAAKLAIEAGMDVDLPLGGDLLLDLVQSGRLDEAVIDRSVARVLKMKFQLGLFEEPYVDPAPADAIVRCPEHRQIALESARKSMVLLKNADATLPLRKDLGTIGIFGPTKDVVNLGDYSGPYGGWGGDGVTPLQGIRQLVSPQTRLLVHDDAQDPVELARQCDTAIIFTAIEEEEGSDRSTLGLPGGIEGPLSRVGATSESHAIIVDAGRRTIDLGDQVGLIKSVIATGVPTVVVLINGSAVAMQEWIEQAPAVLEAWYPGEQGGTAIAETLFGDNNPGGRLPMTFPKAVGQAPLYYNYKPSGRGYAYNDNDGKPLFPFGYGLSYTDFAYSNLRFSQETIAVGDTVTVSVDVTNVGERTGDEVVQLYLHDELASVVRPFKELKGFTRITLAPGETRTVDFALTPEHLAIWDAHMNFVVEPGAFKVMIGSSSEDIKLEGIFTVVE